LTTKLFFMKSPYLKITVAAALVACAVFTLQSCTKVATILTYDLSMQTGSVDFTIPVISDTNDLFTAGPYTNSLNVDSFIKAKTSGQLGAANITSVKLSSVLLVLKNATATSNFEDFSTCYASFYSNTTTTPYTLSKPDNDTAFSSTLSLPVDTTAELKTYLGTDFTYYVTGKLHDVTYIPLQCTVTYTFSIKVQG